MGAAAYSGNEQASNLTYCICAAVDLRSQKVAYDALTEVNKSLARHNSNITDVDEELYVQHNTFSNSTIETLKDRKTPLYIISPYGNR